MRRRRLLPLALLLAVARAAEIPADAIAGLPLPDAAMDFEEDPGDAIAELPDPDAFDEAASPPDASVAWAPGGSVTSTERQINGVPSAGNHILTEEEVDVGWGSTRVEITSDVPVTVQRYYDGGKFLMGQQPVPETYLKVLVTSDCGTNETDIVPAVSVSSDGRISVQVGVSDEETDDTQFLEPSSYEAFWTWVNDFCGGWTPPTANVDPVPVVPVGNCEVGPGVDPTDVCEEGEFCQLPPGVCSVATRRERSLMELMPLPDDVWVGTCERIPEVCIEIYQPVCGCDGVTYENDCKAYGAATSVAYEGECRPAGGATNPCPEGQCPDPNGICMPEVQCFADPCSVEFTPCPEGEACTANYCGGCHAVCASAEASATDCQVDSAFPEKHTCEKDQFCELKPGACTGVSGVLNGLCVLKPEACTLNYMPVCGCDGTTYPNECGARSNGVSVSYEGECDAALSPPAENVADATPSCPDTLTQEMRPDENSVVYYEVVPSNPPGADNGLLCARLEAKSEGWVGFGVSPFGNMIGAAAVIGVPSMINEGTVLKYDLNGWNPRVVLMEESKQTLTGTSVVQEDGMTTIEFQKKLVEEGEIEIKESGTNIFLVARGSTNELGYHGTNRVAFTHDFSKDAPSVTNPTAQMAPPNTDDEGCEEGMSCLQAGASCTKGTETCCGVASPSFQCTCQDMGNGVLQYGFCLFTDACMMPPCCSEGPPAGTPQPAEGTCVTMGQPCDTGIEDDYCCFDMTGGSASYCTQSGGKPGLFKPEMGTVTTVTSATASTTDGSSTTATGTSTVASSTTANSAITTAGMPTVSTSTTTMTFATTLDSSTTANSATTAATVNSETTGAAEGIVPIVGNFPTEAPIESNVGKSPTQQPSAWWELDPDGAENPNSAFGYSRSFSFLAATVLLAIAVCSLIFPGNADNHYWGLGKFAAAALAVSSVFQKSTFRGGNMRKTKNARAQPLSAQRQRAVQTTCRFNLEVLLDACTHDVMISAPASRIVDANVDSTSQQHPENACVTEYAANITFPTTDGNIQQAPANGSVPALSQFGPECLRAVIGRPFIDSTGSSLLAMPMLRGDGADSVGSSVLSWSGDALLDNYAPSDCSAANHSHLLLGEDWTQRALGEHASVASFSAFSIALMSNGAPSTLVEAALRAGLDEVRHAKISFDIASKLLGGKEVGPGPLPASKLDFGWDLEALALAVAREGCLDETLSAFAAAVEAAHITEVLEKSVRDSPYSTVDPDLLASIKKELVTIALDESNHSALAWSTLNWVCSIDSSACDFVRREVFEDGRVERRIQQRADSSFGDQASVLQLMRTEWNKIFDAHLLVTFSASDESASRPVCEKPGSAEVESTHSGLELVSSVTEVIRRQLLCN